MQEPGMQGCLAAEDLRTLQAQSAAKLTIIDVRSPEEYAALHIPGAINIPLSELNNGLIELPWNNIFITVCGKGGGRSAEAATLLKQMGFAKVFYLCGGTFGWFDEK